LDVKISECSKVNEESRLWVHKKNIAIVACQNVCT